MRPARGFPAFPPRPGRRGRSWWARAFVAAMEDAALDATLLRRGRRFAGSGRIGPITVAPGRIAATVEDPDGIYEVVVHLAELTGAEWDRFLDQVRAEAGHLAALLDREVPRSLVRSADAADVALLPTVGDLESDCDCPDIGDPCQHAAALCYQAAWLLDDDPFVLLLLRGRAADELLDLLETAPAPGTPDEPPVRDVDRPVAAAAAYAAPPAALPGPLPVTARSALPVFPAAPGLPPGALEELVAHAAARARELLAEPEDGRADRGDPRGYARPVTTGDDTVTLRPARPDDAPAVAEIWRSGWRDGHLGNVPDELVAARTPASFDMRAAERVGDTVVAEASGTVAGFVMVVGDEVEQVYVGTAHRGSAVAGALLAEAERLVRDGGHPRAWLAVVAGNARARRFYERNGWVDEGPVDHYAVGPDGAIHVPAHRYVKRFR